MNEILGVSLATATLVLYIIILFLLGFTLILVDIKLIKDIKSHNKKEKL